MRVTPIVLADPTRVLPYSAHLARSVVSYESAGNRGPRLLMLRPRNNSSPASLSGNGAAFSALCESRDSCLVVAPRLAVSAAAATLAARAAIAVAAAGAVTAT